MPKIDPKFIKQHFKVTIFRSYIKYLELQFPHIDVREVCDLAGLPLEYLLNEDNWVSIIFERRFMAVLREKTGRGDLCYQVGRIGTSKELVGASIHFLVKHLIPLEDVYLRIPKITNLLNKVVKVEVLEALPGSLRVRVIPLLDELTEPEKKALLNGMPEIVENTRGYFTTIPTLKSLPEATVTITEGPKSGELPTFNIEVNYKRESRLLSLLALAFPALSGLSVFFALKVLSSLSLWEMAWASFSITAVLHCIMIWRSYWVMKSVATQTEDSLFKIDALRRAEFELEATIQELRLTQADLVQSARMAAIGTLAAGVAHEINNAMSFIHLSIPLLRSDIQKLPVSKKSLEILEIMQEGCDRALNIVRALRGQTGSGVESIKEANLHTSIQATLTLLISKLKNKEITVHVEVDPNLQVRLHIGIFNQALANLIGNSADAIPEIGQIEISCVQEKGQVVLKVKDNGSGMSDQVQSQVFDPFFSTKGPQHGNGLGLYIVKKNLAQVGASISLKTKDGGPTEFTVVMPVIEQEEAAESA